jgi:folate-dependent phosphoribosylglycinamide formyltransferase PurN
VPKIFALTCRLAREYGIDIIRSPKEYFYGLDNICRNLRPWYFVNLIKWVVINFFEKINKKSIIAYGLQSPDSFVGVLFTGYMNFDALTKGLDAIPGPSKKIVEVLLHPAIIIGTKDEIFLNRENRNYVTDIARQDELDLLIKDDFRLYAKTKGWTFSDLRGLELAEIKSIKSEDSEVIKNKLRTVLIMDDTPFYQAMYCKGLIDRCIDIDVKSIVIVSLPGGGKLQQYLLKNSWELGIKSLFLLASKSLILRLFNYFPIMVRGEFTSSIATLSRERGIPYLIHRNDNADDYREWVKNFNPDLIISSCSNIFKKEFIKLPAIGFINRHSSLLPSYGGILPVFRCIQKGELYTGVSIHRVVEEIDAGEVLSQKAIRIFKGDTVDKLYSLCFTLSLVATIEAVKKLKGPKNDGVHQLPINKSVKSYYSYPNKADWEEFNARKVPFI